MLHPKRLQPLFQNSDLLAEGLLDVKEAASFLRIGRSKVYQLMDCRDLPYVKFGKARRIPKVALKRYAEERLIGCTLDKV